PGIAMFEAMVGRPVLGTIPYFRDVYVDEEDGLTLQPEFGITPSESTVDIAVIVLPRMSNFTDFVSLQHETGVHLRYAYSPNELGCPDAVIIPGTKNTIEDFLYLRSKGWVEKIKSLVAEGKMLVGICGGFQMLGTSIRDPHHVESNIAQIEGLGFFQIKTEMSHEKTTRQRSLNLIANNFINQEIQVQGYQIHMGETVLQESYHALFRESPALGIISEDCGIWGTYLHGIFDNDDFRLVFVNHLRQRKGLSILTKGLNYAEFRQKQFNKLAEILHESLDLNRIYDVLFKCL
ncbi:cobyric acid synthase CobQ, partial [candidate division KSB1 bacterium]|nr:cobyric acid synthase CobQ [candidate division KSB1 bacterium]NIR70913.1 cobyric acid synthase CobQ [candidate division KSB1 bacterium]NIS23085.1 cobyric acid synthase CobQ [candidate division KSB1 bacterium]NIT69920.1 cobyric acid synthase CobQ [candidate division KSB1 bacterium]NIU23586.1 cobyric acid synthase CobQ [candidate division KSB1 bacterium]